MKTEYRMYRRDSSNLMNNLLKREIKILDDFCKFCSITASHGKVVNYKRYILQFRDVIEKPLDKITHKDAVEFWGLVNHSPYESNTKTGIRKTVKRFLKWFYRDLEMIEPLKVPSKNLVNEKKINKSTLLKPHELKSMLHRAERLRDKVLLILLYETGGRPQEIQNLKWKDINWDEKEVHLYSGKIKEGRDIPIKESIVHLRRWKQEHVILDLREDDYVFPSRIGSRIDRENPMSVVIINRIIKDLGCKAGITRPIHTYLVRHSRLTEIYKKGVKGIEHNKFSGHKIGSKQTGTYVHMDNSDMKTDVLKKVYHIKEITDDYKNQMEKKINNMEEKIIIQGKSLFELSKQIKELLQNVKNNDNEKLIENKKLILMLEQGIEEKQKQINELSK